MCLLLEETAYGLAPIAGIGTTMLNVPAGADGMEIRPIVRALAAVEILEQIAIIGASAS